MGVEVGFEQGSFSTFMTPDAGVEWEFDIPFVGGGATVVTTTHGVGMSGQAGIGGGTFMNLTAGAVGILIPNPVVKAFRALGNMFASKCAKSGTC